MFSIAPNLSSYSTDRIRKLERITMEEITWSNDDSEVPKREMIMTKFDGNC